MNQLYPDAAPGVNWSALSSNCVSFYGWLYRWYQETGDVSPSTPYLARKQRRTQRTIYRWLTDLEAVGAIRREVSQGVERSIVPLLAPPPKQRRRSPVNSHPGARYRAEPTPIVSGVSDTKMSGQCQGSSCIDSLRINSTTQTGVVASLVAEGVLKHVAVQLVEQLGEDPVQEQLQALPHRKPKDRAAVLVSSIKQSWPLPETFKAAVARKQKEAAEAQNRAMKAELAKKRESARQETKAAFYGLPDAVRADLLDRAASALRVELPAAWRMMQNRPPEVLASWITARAVTLAEQ